MKQLFLTNTLFEYISKYRQQSKLYGHKDALKKTYRKLKESKLSASITCREESGNSVKDLPSDMLGFLVYRCNICGTNCKTKAYNLKREEPSCPTCKSTVRMRAMIHILSTELFGKSLALTDFPKRPDITGIGMSDWREYAVPLAEKLGYKNTYYHQEPKLDIVSIDRALEGTLDFILSTDVFEHIKPPVSSAFENARKLLKPGGVMVFSVPYTKGDKTEEHFPELHTYEIVKKENDAILINITKDGAEQTFNNLVFHGGDGSTLEMRLFSESSLMEEFTKAGFNTTRIYKEPHYEFGIVWECDWSLPCAARIK